MVLDFDQFQMNLGKGKSADQIQAISLTSGLLSGRLIGLLSYKIDTTTKKVETTQLVKGCISSLVYFQSKRIAFFTKDNQFVYKYVHTGKLSKFCTFHPTVSNFGIGNTLVKDPHEEHMFVISGKNSISIYGDIGADGHVSCQEIKNIQGKVNYILPGYKRGVFFIVTENGQVHAYIFESGRGKGNQHTLMCTYQLGGFTTCASICPKTRYISISLSDLQGKLTQLVVLEIKQNLDLAEHARIDYTKKTEKLGKRNNSFFSDIVTTYLGSHPLIACIQRSGLNAMNLYMLKDHYMNELASYPKYFSGQAFKACLMRCKSSNKLRDNSESGVALGGSSGKWDCKIWTVDENGKIKSVNIKI